MSLHVGKRGSVAGDIESDDTRVGGEVKGMIKSGSVVLKEGCVLEGDIESQTLAVDHGAHFTGSVRPAGESRVLKLKEAAG